MEETNSILENILQNQNDKISETNDTLDKILEQNENNKIEDVLESQIVLLGELINVVKNKKNEPIEIKVEIVGGEAELVEIDSEEGNENN